MTLSRRLFLIRSAALASTVSYLTATGLLMVALVLAGTLLGRRRTPAPEAARREELDLAA